MLKEDDLFNNRQELLASNISEHIKSQVGYLALMAVNELQLGNEIKHAGYSRAEFGTDGVEPYTTGRDRRLSILKRDLNNIQTYEHPDRCGQMSEYVRYAQYDEPYTGAKQTLIGAGAISQHVNIDHVVSLHDAWNNGADRMSAASRHDFATDTANLLAIDKFQNTIKHSFAIDGYQPDQSFIIQFCAIQALIKRRYKLTVSRREKAAFYRYLTDQRNYTVILPNQPITYYESPDQRRRYPDSWPELDDE